LDGSIFFQLVFFLFFLFGPGERPFLAAFLLTGRAFLRLILSTIALTEFAFSYETFLPESFRFPRALFALLLLVP